MEYQKRYGQYENLSLLMSAIYRLTGSSQRCHEDIDAFYAPSECHGVQASADKVAFVRILVAAGLTPDELYDEVRSRTTSKFAYFSIPMGWDFDPSDMYQNVEVAARNSSDPVYFAFKAGRIWERMIAAERKKNQARPIEFRNMLSSK